MLVSTYDMGRQPFGLASPAAWLIEAGHDVTCVDLAKEKLSDAVIRDAAAVGFFLPMHTATRLAIPVIDRVHRANPAARLIAYGLYAPLNDGLLRDHGISVVLGGEFEADLVRSVASLDSPAGSSEAADGSLNGYAAGEGIARLQFRVPARERLLPLTQYATLQVRDERRTAGYTEASRGCKHRCRHCPIVPVYDGQFRVVAHDVTLDDLAAQVDGGAAHITFGDPDFFNGPTHARRLVQAVAARFPGLTYDVTIKVEHLLRHADLVPVLRDTGCLFVTSAIEAVDDRVLERLAKGHTRADVERVADLMGAAGLPIAPTFVAFTPWTTIDGYVDLLETIARLGWTEAVASIQLAIRLLLPSGSRLMELAEIRAVAGPLDGDGLAHAWIHDDPRVDALQRDLQRLVGRRLNAPRVEVFDAVRALALAAAGRPAVARSEPRAARVTIPYLTEPWYC